MKELIKKLVEAHGPAGDEEQVRILIEKAIDGKVDQMRTDALGNLIALRKGRGGGKRLMVAAHMDEIGVVVTHIDKQGFLRIAPVGGVRPLTMVGSRVRFANGITGVIGREKWLRVYSLPPWNELFLDVGATSPDDAPVSVGDVASFVRPFVDLAAEPAAELHLRHEGTGDRLVSKAMDDRIGCVVAIQALLNMAAEPHGRTTASPNDVYFCFTAQEEVGSRGAVVAAFGVEPEVGLAIDVTDTGDTPEAHPMAVKLGGGPAIKVMDSGMITPQSIRRWMIRAAESLGIDYQLEVLERGGTDGRAIQRSRAGVPTGCLSIPCRYIHTPSEMVDYGDVQAAVRLLTDLISKEIDL